MTVTDRIDALEGEYSARLAQRCQAWQLKHPDEAKALRETAWRTIRRLGQPYPEPGSNTWIMIEEAVNEAVRAKNNWPTIRGYIEIRSKVDE